MKIFYFLFFFLNTLLSLNAQTQFGIKAGYNNSTGIYNQSNFASSKNISGIQFGVFGEKAVNSSWALHSNLVFMQKGNYADYTDEKFPMDHYDHRTYRLNYLELDIALLYKITMGKNSTVKFGIGPYAAVGLSGKETGFFYWFGNRGDINRPVKFSNEKAGEFNQTYFNPFEWGVNFKSSFNYKKYVLYINYGRGISPRVLSKYAGNTSGNDFGKYETGTKNQVLSIGVGYILFKTSKKQSKVSCYDGS